MCVGLIVLLEWLQVSMLSGDEEPSRKQRMGNLTRIRKYAFVRKRETAVKYASLVVLVIQNAAQVLVMRYVRTRPREMFLSTVAVFFTEVVKLVACFLLIIAEERSVSK
ncbi:unnamed protein product [Gongylonema pulchrum]|uniref:7TM_GPCR_Srx domain-containing protein n=1 Tax=Gongylonema pulchrum TaxID=637853 RepID=A0A183ET92_9BILA|nr:unnamed protein product [Gongylonema pulchrum]